jgi:hypothetical protein
VRFFIVLQLLGDLSRDDARLFCAKKQRNLTESTRKLRARLCVKTTDELASFNAQKSGAHGGRNDSPTGDMFP